MTSPYDVFWSASPFVDGLWPAAEVTSGRRALPTWALCRFRQRLGAQIVL